ncbi:hypothetical protein ISE53_10290 [Pseudomonas aeruginosa]|nr:hypothetical protein [Pseudomonas aeruginosa]
MDAGKVIEELEVEWDIEGFFDQVRNGVFDATRAHHVMGLLREIDVYDSQVLPRRLVSLLWYMPVFLGWQLQRVEEKGGEIASFEQFIVDVQNILEEVLGTP